MVFIEMLLFMRLLKGENNERKSFDYFNNNTFIF